ncbi:hypothetical protein JZ751_024100 [Albula glossodonta]|uniref:Uncharacterized protein n=1 Tax=Albula glossodonta TaxID=121402 RepID=A0A8T2NN81_9TELE|nr:hypothetical protein JZ751_024100 [Albula glossodonta]
MPRAGPFSIIESEFLDFVTDLSVLDDPGPSACKTWQLLMAGLLSLTGNRVNYCIWGVWGGGGVSGPLSLVTGIEFPHTRPFREWSSTGLSLRGSQQVPKRELYEDVKLDSFEGEKGEETLIKLPCQQHSSVVIGEFLASPPPPPRVLPLILLSRSVLPQFLTLSLMCPSPHHHVISVHYDNVFKSEERKRTHLEMERCNELCTLRRGHLVAVSFCGKPTPTPPHSPPIPSASLQGISPLPLPPSTSSHRVFYGLFLIETWAINIPPTLIPPCTGRAHNALCSGENAGHISQNNLIKWERKPKNHSGVYVSEYVSVYECNVGGGGGYMGQPPFLSPVSEELGRVCGERPGSSPALQLAVREAEESECSYQNRWEHLTPPEHNSGGLGRPPSDRWVGAGYRSLCWGGGVTGGRPQSLACCGNICFFSRKRKLAFYSIIPAQGMGTPEHWNNFQTEEWILPQFYHKSPNDCIRTFCLCILEVIQKDCPEHDVRLSRESGGPGIRTEAKTKDTTS